VIGVLDLESPQPNYFTEDHVQTLSILAANLAVSLENARLYEQLARDEARLERDLQAAKRIQGALLRPVPTEDYGLEMAARYLSAREVCGDLYEFLRYGPQQLGIALGDVSGKRNGGGALWSGGDRNYAELGATKIATGGNAEANEPIGGRAAHRGAVHDGVLCHVAKRAAETASGKRRAIAAAALQRWPVRKD